MLNSLTNLVITKTDKDVLVVDSRLIAQELGVGHSDWYQNVLTNDKYQIQAEQVFGILRFENGEIKGRGQPQKYALLTEEQATFYMTLSRNTAQVVTLKLKLVKAFSEAKRLLISNEASLDREKPRLKLVEKKRTVKQFISTCKLFLDLVPNLDSNRKATLILSAAKSAYPECKYEADLAQSALPEMSTVEQSYTPTEIGAMLSPTTSARCVNILLESAGLQESYLTARQQKRWRPTALGSTYSVLTIEAKHNGAPTESIRWKAGVVQLITVRAIDAT